MSSAPTGMRAAASISSCAAAPGARAIPASRASSCQPRRRPPGQLRHPVAARRPLRRRRRRPQPITEPVVDRGSGAGAADRRRAEPRDPPHARALLHRPRGSSRGADGPGGRRCSRAATCRTSGRRRRTASDRSSQQAGEAAVREAERLVTLSCIDRAWCDHLALAADLREGIHLVALGGLDPLSRYTTELNRSFEQIDEQIDAADPRRARRRPRRGPSPGAPETTS